MHIKKSKMSKLWPVPRKGKRKVYVAVPSHSTSKGISILFILRDLLGIVKTRKEARYMTFSELVKVNNKIRTDENFPVQVFDTINLEKGKLHYRLEILNRKFSLKEISSKEAETKVVKISGKTIIGKNLVQMNLEDGQNMISKDKFSVGDSVILNTIKNEIKKILPLKDGANIEVIAGKHAGKTGKLNGSEELSRGRDYIVELNGEEVRLPYKTILVIE